jgi:hypothetical protein
MNTGFSLCRAKPVLFQVFPFKEKLLRENPVFITGRFAVKLSWFHDHIQCNPSIKKSIQDDRKTINKTDRSCIGNFTKVITKPRRATLVAKQATS